MHSQFSLYHLGMCMIRGIQALYGNRRASSQWRQDHRIQGVKDVFNAAFLVDLVPGPFFASHHCACVSLSFEQASRPAGMINPFYNVCKEDPFHILGPWSVALFRVYCLLRLWCFFTGYLTPFLEMLPLHCHLLSHSAAVSWRSATHPHNAGAAQSAGSLTVGICSGILPLSTLSLGPAT